MEYVKRVVPALSIAAFLAHVGGYTCKTVSCQLEIGESMVSSAVHEISRKICQQFEDTASFRTSNEDVRPAMNSLKSILDHLYCFGAIDGLTVLIYAGSWAHQITIMTTNFTKSARAVYCLNATR